MKICLAGSDANLKYNEIMFRCNAKSKLESYYSLGKKNPSKGFEFYLLDSGGFVARIKGVKIDVEDYAKYIVNNNVKFAFNLDTSDISETLYNQRFLENNTKSYIIPVFHKDDDFKLLFNNYSNYPYIGLGGCAKTSKNNISNELFYKKVFSFSKDKIKYHGLGQTTKSILETFPFYSVDSTSWLSFAQYGNSRVIKGNMTKVYAKHNGYLKNTEIECKYWVDMEKYITELWKSRGVTWND